MVEIVGLGSSVRHEEQVVVPPGVVTVNDPGPLVAPLAMASTTVIAVAVVLVILVTVTPEAEKLKPGVPENPVPDTVKVYELFIPTVEGEIELTVGTGGAGTVKQSLQVSDVESGLSMVKL
jgi:hypothetical protein